MVMPGNIKFLFVFVFFGLTQFSFALSQDPVELALSLARSNDPKSFIVEFEAKNSQISALHSKSEVDLKGHDIEFFYIDEPNVVKNDDVLLGLNARQDRALAESVSGIVLTQESDGLRILTNTGKLIPFYFYRTTPIAAVVRPSGRLRVANTFVFPSKSWAKYEGNRYLFVGNLKSGKTIVGYFHILELNRDSMVYVIENLDAQNFFVFDELQAWKLFDEFHFIHNSLETRSVFLPSLFRFSTQFYLTTSPFEEAIKRHGLVSVARRAPPEINPRDLKLKYKLDLGPVSEIVLVPEKSIEHVPKGTALISINGNVVVAGYDSDLKNQEVRYGVLALGFPTESARWTDYPHEEDVAEALNKARESGQWRLGWSWVRSAAGLWSVCRSRAVSILNRLR
jgi:hypothetical protein